MKTFVFYPEIYTTYVGNILFSFDTKNGRHHFSHMYSCNKNPRYTVHDAYSENIINDLISAQMGYVISSKVVPFVLPTNLHLISSLERTMDVTGMKEGYHIKDMLTQIHLWGHNETFDVNRLVYAQINYPVAHDNSSELSSNQLQTIMRSRAGIILSGDFDSYMLRVLIPLTTKSRDNFIIRTVYIESLADTYKNVLDKSLNIHLELLVISPALGNGLLNIVETYEDRISVVYYISSSLELKQFIDAPFKHKMAAVGLTDVTMQETIISRMLLNEDDIMSPNFTLNEIYQKGKYNTSSFGELTIDSDGNVMVLSKIIGNINAKSLLEILNDWTHLKTCEWRIPRCQWPPCANCLLSALCPCLSVYELQGVIPRCCKDNVFRKYSSVGKIQ